MGEAAKSDSDDDEDCDHADSAECYGGRKPSRDLPRAQYSPPQALTQQDEITRKDREMTKRRLRELGQHNTR